MSAIGPFACPAEGIKAPTPTPLTADQQTKYNEFLTTVKNWNGVPKSLAKDAESEALSDPERLWLTRECLLRYLRATKWDLSAAAKRLQETISWRREYGMSKLTADYISEENATGKQVILGFDNEGRACLYLLPNKQNTQNSPRQVQHLVYSLERTLDISPPGQEALALLIDFRNSSSGTQPSIATCRQVLYILQNHYPERLGRAYLTHLPWYVTTMLKLISPFIDPVTKTKLRYNEPLIDHVPASQLMKNAGGELDFKYDHSIYWPALDELAAQRQKERTERWEKAGKHIGESEVYLWGGDEPSIIAPTAVQDAPKTDEPQPVATTTEGDAVASHTKEGNVTTGASTDVPASDDLAFGVAKLDVKDTPEPVKVAA